MFSHGSDRRAQREGTMRRRERTSRAWTGLVVGMALMLGAGCSLPPSPKERCNPDCPARPLPHPLY